VFEGFRARRESRLIVEEHAALDEILAELEGIHAVLSEVEDQVRTSTKETEE